MTVFRLVAIATVTALPFFPIFFLFRGNPAVYPVFLAPPAEEALKMGLALLFLAVFAAWLRGKASPELLKKFRIGLFFSPVLAALAFGIIEAFVQYAGEHPVNLLTRDLGHVAFTTLAVAVCLVLWRAKPLPLFGSWGGVLAASPLHGLLNSMTVPWTQLLFTIAISLISLAVLAMATSREPQSDPTRDFLLPGIRDTPVEIKFDPEVFGDHRTVRGTVRDLLPHGMRDSSILFQLDRAIEWKEGTTLSDIMAVGIDMDLINELFGAAQRPHGLPVLVAMWQIRDISEARAELQRRRTLPTSDFLGRGEVALVISRAIV